MNRTDATNITGASRDTFIVCRNSQGVEVRATPLRMTRFAATFEVYNPFSIVQLSEVLSEFKIVMSDRVVYSGRAVVSSIVNAGIMVVCDARDRRRGDGASSGLGRDCRGRSRVG